MRLEFQVINGLLAPMSDEVSEAVRRWGNGSMVLVEAVRPRNNQFLRKFFALLQVGFDAFEPAEYRGSVPMKNKERFRKEIIILAGYYETVASLKGDVRAEAKSISFARMSEDEFAELYDKVATVILHQVLRNYTRDDLDQQVEKVMGFV